MFLLQIALTSQILHFKAHGKLQGGVVRTFCFWPICQRLWTSYNRCRNLHALTIILKLMVPSSNREVNNFDILFHKCFATACKYLIIYWHIFVPMTCQVNNWRKHQSKKEIWNKHRWKNIRHPLPLYDPHCNPRMKFLSDRMTIQPCDPNTFLHFWFYQTYQFFSRCKLMSKSSYLGHFVVSSDCFSALVLPCCWAPI